MAFKLILQSLMSLRNNAIRGGSSTPASWKEVSRFVAKYAYDKLTNLVSYGSFCLQIPCCPHSVSVEEAPANLGSQLQSLKNRQAQRIADATACDVSLLLNPICRARVANKAKKVTKA